MTTRDDEFLLGELTANVKMLTTAVDELRSEMSLFRIDINDLKLFRAKLVGMTVTVSVLLSVLATVATNAMRLWAR